MRQRGFTLIELMITVAIVVILATIAIPSFSSYILKSHRIDAKDALTTIQFSEEKYRANQTAYTGNLADLGLSNTTQQKYYAVSLVATGTGYIGMASITGSQAKDTGCPNLVVTERGFVTDKSYTVGSESVDAASSAYKTCWGLR